jgi:hypothetical protein
LLKDLRGEYSSIYIYSGSNEGLALQQNGYVEKKGRSIDGCLEK